MNKSRIILLINIILMLGIVTACMGDEQKGVITEVNNVGKQAVEPSIEVVNIEKLEHVEIHDWLDEATVLVSKENESLSKFTLEELSEMHPKSLYWYALESDSYELILERENVMLGGASLSPDHKHLIYQDYTLGDAAFHVMNLETRESFRLSGEPIAGALSAKWVDNDTLIGSSYQGVAYVAKTTGEITALDRFSEESLFIVEPMKGNIYYNTHSDNTLRVLDLTTMETTSLGLEHVSNVYPSPDGNQILVLQHINSRMILTLSDAEGKNQVKIAEGTELGGVSWSPDQGLIAYTKKTDQNSSAVNILYVHDLLTKASTQLAVDINNASTAWSPSGHALAYTEYSKNQNHSSIVYLEYSLKKDDTAS